jgi:hypothetical protein
MQILARLLSWGESADGRGGCEHQLLCVCELQRQVKSVVKTALSDWCLAIRTYSGPEECLLRGRFDRGGVAPSALNLTNTAH